MDRAVASGCAGHDGVAVLALGSAARAELTPASDIDLLFVHDGRGPADLEAAVAAVCYPLWDAGLSVGHAVHTPRSAVRAAADRLESATALVERRLVAGEHGLAEALAERWRRWLRRHGNRVLADLVEADTARHATAGARPGALEPDLKRTAGGLRDVQSLRWAAACLLGADGPDALEALVGARYLSARDLPALGAAARELLAVRCALHLEHGLPRPPGALVDTLRLDLQDAVAARLGWGDGDDLLRRVGLAMRRIAYMHRRAWPSLRADARAGRSRRRPAPVVIADGIVLDDGLVELADGRDVRTEPALAMRAISAAAVHGTHLGRRSADALTAGILTRSRLPWDAETRAGLLRTLRQGAAAADALADADAIGLLPALLPGWERLRGAPQRNPLHRSDLDTHLFATVAELVALADGGNGPPDPAEQERLAALFDQVDEPEVLLLAAWLHDIGKVEAGAHAVTGARTARAWVTEMGFGSRRAARVAALVEAHLVLPEAAVRRDVRDPADLASVAAQLAAAQIEDRGHLDALYLLALADGRATGPSVATPWREGLLAELHGGVRRLLSGAEAIPLAPDDVAAQAARSAGEAAVAAVLDGAPRGYRLSASAAQIAAHAALLDSEDGLRGAPVVALRAGEVAETRTLSLLAADRPGLFADVAGALAGHGVDVLEARAFTRADGLALDWFVLRDGAPGELTAAVIAAAEGTLDAGELVARWERRRDVRPPTLARPVGVEVTIDRGVGRARIEVAGPAAPGVLHRLAAVLAEARIDVLGARVATLGPEVRDVFFVRSEDLPVDDAALVDRLRRAAGWSTADTRAAGT